MDETANILVVDDDPSLRGLVRDFLAGHGFRVSEADGGAAMRAVLETEPVDIVVLDVMMPGEDGLSLCRQLQAQPGLAGREVSRSKTEGAPLRRTDYFDLFMLICSPAGSVSRSVLGAVVLSYRDRDEHVVIASDPSCFHLVYGVSDMVDPILINT